MDATGWEMRTREAGLLVSGTPRVPADSYGYRAGVNEKKMVKKLLAGDRRAQQDFFHAYRLGLYRTCVHFLGNGDADAEDITQETFLIALQKIHSFDFKHKLNTWLTQITINLCFERIRKRRRLLCAMEDEIESIAGLSRQHPWGAVDQTVNEEGEERLGLVRRVVQAMGEQCRRLIELRDFQGESYAQIGRIINAPLGTVMSRLHRCRQTLKDRVLVLLGSRT